MKVKYSPESIQDLQRLYDSVAGKSPLSVRRIALDVQEGVEKLKAFPKIGLPVARAPKPELLRDLYIGKYTVRYLIPDLETLAILRIRHNKEVGKDS